jgi:hypothetical protein
LELVQESFLARESDMRNKIPPSLAAFHIALAFALSLWGASQAKQTIWGTSAIDYIPPAEFALHLINLPTALLTAGIFGKWSFQITPEYSMTRFVVYIILIGIFWLLIGIRFESLANPPRIQSAFLKSSRVFGIAVGGVMLLMALILARSPHGYMVPIGAFLWGAVLLFLFGRAHPLRRF